MGKTGGSEVLFLLVQRRRLPCFAIFPTPSLVGGDQEPALNPLKGVGVDTKHIFPKYHYNIEEELVCLK
jgi:hypothetical protein